MQNHHRAFNLLSAIALLLTATSVSAVERYHVDTVQTYVLFKVKHFDFGYSYGRFNGPTGSIVWDDANPANSSIEMTVNAADVNTAVDKRDQHIRSADFLNVKKYTTIAFKSTSVKKLTADAYAVTGELTLLGKTRPITVKARQTGVGKDPWGNYIGNYSGKTSSLYLGQPRQSLNIGRPLLRIPTPLKKSESECSNILTKYWS